MQDYDDEPVRRPRWIGWIIIIGMTLVVLGLLNLGVRLYLGIPADHSTEQSTELTETSPTQSTLGSSE